VIDSARKIAAPPARNSRGGVGRVARQPVRVVLALKVHSDSMGSTPESRLRAQRSTRVNVPSPRSPSRTERNAAKLRLSPGATFARYSMVEQSGVVNETVGVSSGRGA